MSRRNDIFVVSLLFASTIGLYSRTFTYEFLNYDDDQYVYENPQVKSGVSLDNVVWAFTTVHAANWHPVTWISHMLDVQLYGTKHPGGHHATSVILHAINACLLYALVRRFTCHWWLAAMAGALFAWHPLRVESVAWVAERKDVLAGLFWLSATHAYISYSQQRSAGRYAMLLILLALGLMSKPMLVTFPFALILLDIWPLKRLSLEKPFAPENGRLLLEKLPMVLLVIGSSTATFLAQHAGRAVAMTETISLGLRIENAGVAVMTYLRQFLAPVNLSFFYPHPVFIGDGTISASKWISCLAAIALISALAIVSIRKAPFLFVGWFFFIGTLVPVIGLVQVGAQAMADRYTYIPMIGICVMVVCIVGRAFKRSQQLQPIIGAIVGIVLLALLILTRQQISNWKDSRTLMSRALNLDDQNFIAHNNLGIILDEEGFKDAAAEHFSKAVTICSRFPHAEFNLANVLEATGDIKEALRHFNRAVKLDPEYAGAYNNYGNLLAKLGRAEDAILVYQQGVKQCPNDWLLKHHLATSLAARGDYSSAIRLWREALKINPSSAETHRLLGMTLAMVGGLHDAVIHLLRAVDLQPDNTDAMNALAWIWATASSDHIRNPEMAEKLAARACELTRGENAAYLDTLAAAFAAEEKYDRAQQIVDRAIGIASRNKDERLLEQLRARKALYSAKQPYVTGK